MTIFAWVGLIGILVLTFLPFLYEENRTKTEYRKAAITAVIVIGIILSVLIFEVSYIIALFTGLLLYILLSRKTYTKKRLLIYGSIVLLMAAGLFMLLRDNPKYVLDHLQKNPETTSFYAVQDGAELIAYEADTVRPLASTVKILIAAEYAVQAEEGKVDPESRVRLSDLARYYVKDTDGGAYPEWIAAMEEEGKVRDDTVTLHDVVKGMIRYSSNANTDYLIHALGHEAIDSRAAAIGLTKHEPVYPIAGALLIPVESDAGKDIEALNALSMEAYRDLAFGVSREMKDGAVKAEEIAYNEPLSVQEIWSDRLPGATAREYGKLLSIISNEELPGSAAELMRDVMEWPMDMNPGNQTRFRHLGAKGGSTAFILNDALYAEEIDGGTFELVLFTEGLKIHQMLLLQMNLNSFESKFIGDETFREKVISVLGGE